MKFFSVFATLLVFSPLVSAQVACTERTIFDYDSLFDNGLSCASLEDNYYTYFPGSGSCESIAPEEEIVITSLNSTTLTGSTPALPQIKVSATGANGSTCNYTTIQTITYKNANDTLELSFNATECSKLSLSPFTPSNVSALEVVVKNIGTENCDFNYNFFFQDISELAANDNEGEGSGKKAYGHTVVPAYSTMMTIILSLLAFFQVC